MTAPALLLLLAAALASAGGRGRAEPLHPSSAINSPAPEAFARFGAAIATGDVNGDGALDLVAGEPGSGLGKLHVFSGPSYSSSITVANPGTAQAFAEAVATGDVNGDGYDDVIAGSKYANAGTAFGAGEAWVFFGPSLTTNVRLTDPEPQGAAAFGVSVAAGDVNGDGYDEVVAGAWDSNIPPHVKSGQAFVFAAPSLTSVVTLQSPNPQTVADFGVATHVADFTGDGIGDVVVGSWLADVRESGDNAGQVFVFPGPSLSSVIPLSDTTVPGFRLGQSLASANLDGDGAAEIVAGASGYAVIFDSAGGGYTARRVTPPAGWISGYVPVRSGDATGDGVPDLLLGMPETGGGGADAGGALLLPGPLLDRAYKIELSPQQAGAEFGRAIAIGAGRMFASAHEEDTAAGASAGRVHVIEAMDADGDTWLIDDNCPAVANPTQANADRDFVELGAARLFDDLTWPASDNAGDACDDDDDNDGLSDAVESAGLPCPSATGATLPLVRDTDGDRVLDGAECALGSDPANAASKPAAIVEPDADRDGLPDALDPSNTNGDADADGLRDGVEFRNYASNPSSSDSDGDGCPDTKEVASVTADRSVEVVDLQQIASAAGTAASPGYLAAFDPNKDGGINVIDLQFAARHIGAC